MYSARVKQYNDKHPEKTVGVMGFDIGKEQAVINFILNKYIIPFNHEQAQQYVYLLHSDITDADKVQFISCLIVDNQQAPWRKYRWSITNGNIYL